MEPKLQVLNLFLQALGEDVSVASLEDRLRLQKAVYLGQLFGVDLGYRYSWYVKGPYSPSLTQDYYRLCDEGASSASEQKFVNEVEQKLTQAKGFLEKPDCVELSKAHWYELLASLHYLYQVSSQAKDKVFATIRSTKPHLIDYVDSGENHLKKFGLLNK